MQLWLKRTLMAGFMIVAVWALVIVYWQVKVHMPTVPEIILYLVLSPAIMLLSVFYFNKFAVGLIFSNAEASAIAVTSSSSVVNEQSAQAELEWVLQILSGSVMTKYGQTVNDLATAIIEKSGNFQLDAELVDANGYPVLSGRIFDFDETDIFQKFEEWAAGEVGTGVLWESEDKRTIALAHGVFMELIQELLLQPELSSLLPNGVISKSDKSWPELHLLNIWPVLWTAEQKILVNSWFEHLLMLEGWPSEKLVPNPLNMMDFPNALSALDRMNVQIHQQNAVGLYLMIASQSNLGEKTFAAWEATGQHEMRKVPGEAAAGVVVTDVTLVDKFGVTPVVQMHRLAQRQRDKSADEAGRVKPDVLIETIKDALIVSKVGADSILKVTSDTDERASRTGELLEAIAAVAPELDLDVDCLRLESRCGSVGVASGLVVLLLAREQVIQHKQPAICISNNHGFERSVLVLDIIPVPVS